MGKPGIDNEVSRRVIARAKVLRQRKGLAAVALAKRMTDLGYPTTGNTIANIETRKTHVHVDMACALAAGLDVPLSALIDAACAHCDGSPPPGFACSTCGAETPRRE
jgi:transcriptional regulator with XRE-family HTH domain